MVLGLALAVSLVRLVVQQRLKLLRVGQSDLGEPACVSVSGSGCRFLLSRGRDHMMGRHQEGLQKLECEGPKKSQWLE